MRHFLRHSLYLPCQIVCALLPVCAWAAHPLVSDDTGTQGAGAWQYELNTDQGVFKQEGIKTREGQINTGLTYGLTPRIDLSLGVPYSRIASEGDDVVKGVGDVAASLKWRFFEQDNISFALKPELFLPTGQSDKGLGNGRTSAAITGLAMLEHDQWTFIGNLGGGWNNNVLGDKKFLWRASAAALFAVTESVQLTIDSGIYRHTEAEGGLNPAFALVGVIWSPYKQLDLDVGYKHGLNSAEVRYSVGAGLTLRF